MARLPSLLDPPIGFGHRGARAHAPENTIEGFTLALRLGATGLESDVWRSSDGEVVLDHDGVVRSGVRKRAIADVARAALPGHVPTLGELYDAVGTGIPLSLDVKDGDAADGIVATARAAGGDAVGHLWLCSPRWEEAAEWKRRWPDVHVVDSTRRARMKEGSERRAATLADAGIDAVNLHWTDWNGGLTTLFHRFEIVTFGWDCQHRRQLDGLLDMGIDGLFSDHVDRMVDALEGRPARPET
ncbi:MAG: glycerophosphoryl diester phosphodiesterase [Actinomycetota bacterium]|nr:glycerophosphoryl diester phosphodiesterase [Actinomycetota bacterium]